ncbi:MAG: hypothetical protein E6Q06_01925 [Candidatus Moraniibacteriota bacterium]|nr:MAG: hypothetical protein E6Q06_01925 [Candidatus Moranbacteria bacterium]
MKRCGGNVFKFFPNRKAATEKWQSVIRNWTEDDFLVKQMRRDDVFYKASNMICGPTNAGKSMFISWFLLNLMHVHRDKRFLIFIFSETSQALTKLEDIQSILLKDEPPLVVSDYDRACSERKNLTVWTNKIEQIKQAFNTIEAYYKALQELTESGDVPATNLPQLVFSKLQQENRDFDLGLVEKLASFTDYIFYFDDCLETVLNPKANGAKELLSKLQTTNRHFFITTVYSLQNIKIKSEVFCGNLTNMFVIGPFNEIDTTVFEKYNALLKARFGQQSNMALYNAGLAQIFKKPAYTAQLFSKRFPDAIYWGILPLEYIKKMEAKEARRIGLKRSANECVNEHMKNKRPALRPSVPSASSASPATIIKTIKLNNK